MSSAAAGVVDDEVGSAVSPRPVHRSRARQAHRGSRAGPPRMSFRSLTSAAQASPLRRGHLNLRPPGPAGARSGSIASLSRAWSPGASAPGGSSTTNAAAAGKAVVLPVRSRCRRARAGGGRESAPGWAKQPSRPARSVPRRGPAVARRSAGGTRSSPRGLRPWTMRAARRVSGSEKGRGPGVLGRRRGGRSSRHREGKLRLRSTPRPLRRVPSAAPSGLRFADDEDVRARVGTAVRWSGRSCAPAHSSPWMQPKTSTRPPILGSPYWRRRIGRLPRPTDDADALEQVAGPARRPGEGEEVRRRRGRSVCAAHRPADVHRQQRRSVRGDEARSRRAGIDGEVATRRVKAFAAARIQLAGS